MTSYIAPGNVHYSYAELEGLWIKAGGNPSAAPMAAAIATAESSGNSTATDIDTNGSVDRGLWQINSVHGSQSTYDIMGNARAAVAISGNGTNWEPWVTYQKNEYQKYLQGGTTPDTSVPVNATDAAANQPNASTGTSTAASGASSSQSSGPSGWDCLVPTNWVPCLIDSIVNPILNIIAGTIGIVAGGAMMGIGLYAIYQDARSSSSTPTPARVTGAEKAAAIRQETALKQIASRERIAALPTATERNIAARERPRTVRTTVTTKRSRDKHGNQKVEYISHREAINNEANGYKNRTPH